MYNNIKRIKTSNLSINKERLKQDVLTSLNHSSSVLPMKQKEEELETISKEYEESFFVKGKCENKEKCVGYLIPLVNDSGKGYSLRPFETPNGKKYGVCVLCLRRKVTIEWIRLLKNNVTAPFSILPYQNKVEDYKESDFIPCDANDHFRGITHPFVFFSLSKYTFDNEGNIKHNKKFYQVAPLASLPQYLTIEGNAKVGLLIDITNILAYVLFPCKTVEQNKNNEQAQLIQFIIRVMNDSLIVKKEKDKYRYLLNSCKFVFETSLDSDAVKEMVFYLCHKYIPFVFEIEDQQPAFYNAPIKEIALFGEEDEDKSILVCLECKSLNSVYLYDVVNNLFVCKKNAAHHLIPIHENKNILIQFHGANYLPCLQCGEFKRIASGLTIPERNPKMEVAKYKQMLKKIDVMDVYSRTCMFCKSNFKVLEKCELCGIDHKPTIRKAWYQVKVFNDVEQKIVHVCHNELRLKNDSASRVWSLPLLLESIKKL